MRRGRRCRRVASTSPAWAINSGSVRWSQTMLTTGSGSLPAPLGRRRPDGRSPRSRRIDAAIRSCQGRTHLHDRLILRLAGLAVLAELDRGPNGRRCSVNASAVSTSPPIAVIEASPGAGDDDMTVRGGRRRRSGRATPRLGRPTATSDRPPTSTWRIDRCSAWPSNMSTCFVVEIFARRVRCG